MAAAIGVGIDVQKPEGNMIIDIGGGTTEIAVVALGGIVCDKSVKIAGDVFTNDISYYLRTHHNLYIGERTAERVKIEVGSAVEELDTCQLKIFRPQRQYEINTSGNLLGYTNQVNSALHQKEISYYIKGDIAGITGIERSYEKQLRGVKGMRYIQKDIAQRNIGSYKDGKLDKQVVPGEDLTLTIDYDLQKTAEEMLINKHGAIVALDPNNGEILVWHRTGNRS
ncbi:hypothetical protein FQR65_LT18282 [Abscondita terminalis]|nr:hypothetical protein FQR65_LT18282 [Abscondita terminalis]